MKRPIKFRGKIATTHEKGKYIYGDLCTNSLQGTACIRMVWRGIPAKIEVDPESVAQLCGTDINGQEVFEGDVLIDELEQEHIAEIYDRPQFLVRLKLKEQDNDKEECDCCCAEP